jgi:predicted transcriptional regulator
MVIGDMVAAARANLATIADDAKLIDAAKVLSSGTDMLVVCDEAGVMQGVLTKSDVVRQVSVCAGATCQCPVTSAMTRDIVLCHQSERLHDVSQVMKLRHFKNIPVVDDDMRPLAVLTARGILRLLLKDSEFNEAELIDYVKGVGYR